MWQPRALPQLPCKTCLEYSKPHWIDTRVKYSNYPYTPSAQTLRPPTFNTGYPSYSHDIDRESSHGSSDSGYGTRTPSVASASPKPSYPTQSYPVQNSPFQNYSTQSYFPNRQLSQEGPTYFYSDARCSSSIETFHGAPLSASEHREERRVRYGTIPVCLCK